MKLGRKARYMLEMFAVVGAETMTGVLFPRNVLLGAGGWHDNRDMMRRLRSMRERGFISLQQAGDSSEWIIHITDLGKNALRGKVDPEAFWRREWDGKWRIVGFDLPAIEHGLRRELIDWLRERRFGCLQQSLWVTPCFDKEWYDDLANLKVDPSSASFIEGCSFAESSDGDFVDRAWDFADINRRYSEMIEFLENDAGWGGGVGAESWLKKEVELWNGVFERDPFLPNALIPKGYLGKEALAIRRKVYATLV